MADQWEYQEVVIERGDNRLAQLNQLGAEGWEVATMEPVLAMAVVASGAH